MKNTVIAVLVAAGSSARMGFDKLLTPLSGSCPLERSFNALEQAGVDGMVVVCSAHTDPLARELCSRAAVPAAAVSGGESRQQSVLFGLRAAKDLWQEQLQGGGDPIVLIHDAARCMVPLEVVRSCMDAAAAYGSAVAALPVADTVWRQDDAHDEPLDRSGLWRLQTPQCFPLIELTALHEELAKKGTAGMTDDTSVWAGAGHAPHFVPGSRENEKLTTPEDWAMAERRLQSVPRFGNGFDTHRLTEGRKLILCGVQVPYEKGLLGHSDADVAVHALMDAILGAAALPDIGRLFPDNDPAFEGADSMKLLHQVLERVREQGLRVRQADVTIIAQRPKLAPHMPAFRQSLAEALGIPGELVGVKATTTEGMNDEGKGLCISAFATAVLTGR